LASDIHSQKQEIATCLEEPERERALQTILRVGTSAGGARAKALIAWRPSTEEVRSGQLEAPQGFSHWLLKFARVSSNKDKELEDPEGYGLIEYANSRMAREAGISMADCHLHNENGRSHLMTKCFDRDSNGKTIHMQSLGALADYAYNEPGIYSTEQAFLVIRQLGLPMHAVEQQYRRMVLTLWHATRMTKAKTSPFL
jgi:serine/threonine-protein kinase HipA